MTDCTCKHCKAAARAAELRVIIEAHRSHGEEPPQELLTEMRECADIILGVKS